MYFPQLTQLWNGDLTPRDGEDEREEICTILTKADPKISKGSKPSLPKTIYKVILLSLFFFFFFYTLKGHFKDAAPDLSNALVPSSREDQDEVQHLGDCIFEESQLFMQQASLMDGHHIVSMDVNELLQVSGTLHLFPKL